MDGGLAQLEGDEGADRRHDRRGLEKIDALELLKPEGAIYAFPQAKDPAFDSAAFAMELLEKKGVHRSAPGAGSATTPGASGYRSASLKRS